MKWESETVCEEVLRRRNMLPAGGGPAAAAVRSVDAQQGGPGADAQSLAACSLCHVRLGDVTSPRQRAR